MKIGSFNPTVCGESLTVPAILFGNFAVHSSLGLAADKKGRVKDTRSKITLSHCPTGLSLEFFDDLMFAVHLADEMQKSVPLDVAESTDMHTLHSRLGDYFRAATLAVIGRDIGVNLSEVNRK